MAGISMPPGAASAKPLCYPLLWLNSELNAKVVTQTKAVFIQKPVHKKIKCYNNILSLVITLAI